MRTVRLCLLCLLLSLASLEAQAPIRGYPREPVAAPATGRAEGPLAAGAGPHSGVHPRTCPREPHAAGSPRSREVAEYALGLLKEWGLDARIESLRSAAAVPQGAPAGNDRARSPTGRAGRTCHTGRPGLRRSPTSLPTYNAYSGSGDVTAPLVYVNYGIPEDYETLQKLGIDVKRQDRDRALRPELAGHQAQSRRRARRGRLPDLLRPEGRRLLPGRRLSPRAPSGRRQGVQRGSVMDMPLYVGDPLSPGWASEPGSKRLSLAEAATLLKIPVLPISYEDAQPLLANLGGPVAPEAWRGALPLTYHIGPGPATVRLQVELDQEIRPVYNVIATIAGSELPDQWVIYGNHHDAWVNGASDPASGAAVVLETARSLAALAEGRLAAQAHHHPGAVGRRGVRAGRLDRVAREAPPELDAKAVVYLNSDTNGKGWISAGGSPMLEQFVRGVLDDIYRSGHRQEAPGGPQDPRGDATPGGPRRQASR